MKFDLLMNRIGHLPLLETGHLKAYFPGSGGLEVQLSRWVRQGKLLKIKRGVYIPAEIYRRTRLYEPYLAGVLMQPSYLSLEKALEFHNLIPEAVSIYTSVTTRSRPAKFETPLGIFDYRHLRLSLFWGYNAVTLNGQTGFMASPEKALLDLFYLRALPASEEAVEGLRLENVEKLNLKKLSDYAGRFAKPKIRKAASLIREYSRQQKSATRVL